MGLNTYMKSIVLFKLLNCTHIFMYVYDVQVMRSIVVDFKYLHLIN